MLTRLSHLPLLQFPTTAVSSPAFSLRGSSISSGCKRHQGTYLYRAYAHSHAFLRSKKPEVQRRYHDHSFHNPAKYNGYKVYGSDGCQLTLDAAEIVLKISKAFPCLTVQRPSPMMTALQTAESTYIPQSVIDSYLDEVSKQGIHTDLVKSSGLKVVYTPLNGTGNKPVRAILKKIGVEDVTVVPEQEYPDRNFPTCPFPNPEIKEALAKGLELCNVVKPDLLLATDPDCDRVGIAVPAEQGGYQLLTGNEVGAVLARLHLLRTRRKNGQSCPNVPSPYSTIVSNRHDRSHDRQGVRRGKLIPKCSPASSSSASRSASWRTRGRGRTATSSASRRATAT